MKPYLLVTGDFVKTGGMDQCNHALATYLADRGTETHLVAYRVDEQLAHHPNIRFHRVPKPLGSYFLGNPLLNRIGRTEARRITRLGGRVVVNGGNCKWPDVNWAHHLHTRYQPAVKASLLRRLKAEIEFRQAAIAEREALACAKVIIVESRAIREELIADFGIQDSRIHMLDLGVDREMFRIPTADERLAARTELGLTGERIGAIFVGAIGDRRKGFDTLYLAWKKLCADPGWDAELFVVGAGFELPAWKTRAMEDGLAGRIRFMGFSPATDFVARLLHGCDVLAAPTRYEGYGLAIQEAVCCGVPAIASSLAPVSDRFRGALSELRLDDPENVSALVDRFYLWRSRRAEFRTVTAGLSDCLRKWTWRDMAEQLTRIVEASA